MCTALGIGLGLAFVQGGSGTISIPSAALSAAGVAANLEIDFLRDRWLLSGVIQSGGAATAVTCTRSTSGYYQNRAGLLTSVALNTLRTGDMGALIEGAATNVAIQNRDLTNVAWTKTNCTAAKDQIGPDGVTNSASSLTATGATATCLQSITLASSARMQSAFVKRISGSGVIEMTTDGGTTWVAILPRTYWDQAFIPVQTVTNPSVGFRITTSGDAIAVDFVQNETATGSTMVAATSPIATTTIAASRGADLVRPVNIAWLNATGMTVYFAGARGVPSNASPATHYQLSNSGNSSLFFANDGTSQLAFFGRDSAAVAQWNISRGRNGNAAVRQRRVTVQAAALNDVAMYDEAAILSTDAAATVPVVNRVSIGSTEATSPYDGNVHRIAAWSSRILNASALSVARQGAELVLITEGDSIPRTPTNTNSLGFPGHLGYLADQKWIIDNIAVSSSTVVNGTDALSLSGTRLTVLNALLTAYKAANPSKKVLTLVMCGHNDLANNGHDAIAYTNQLSTYLDTLKSNGHTTVVCTVTPSTSNILFNPARAIANTTIRNWVGGRVDFIVDWDNTVMGVDANASDTTLFSDGIHPTEFGKIIYAEYLKTVIDTIAAA